MVASRQVEIPYCRAVGRQRGRGLGALAQVVGRTAIHFLPTYLVPAAKRIGADMLKFAAPEIEEVIRRPQRVWEGKLRKINCVAVVNRGEMVQQNLLNNPVGREETMLRTFVVDHVEQFSVPTFCGSVWKCWREGPNCWRCLVLAWTINLSNYLTWWKLHRIWISNESELLRWFETVFFRLEAQTCQGTWLRYTLE